jgi:hypothetical protein
MGITFVHLKETDEALLSGALQTVYRNVQGKQSERKSGRTAKAAKSSR